MRLGRTCVLALLCWLSCAVTRAQPYHFEDSLRGGTTGNASGGSFGADGWTVTGVSDGIWYALPRLTSGTVEVTVANITAANLPLADHEIFAMYEAGYGIGEPIDYGSGFRLNHYKVLARLYGTAEPSRFGAMKLMWGMCPSGAPGRDGCGCASFFEEPFGDPLAWTGAPVRLRVAWGDGHTRLFRDGVEIVGVDWSGSGLTFGPSELHMMLGSPRNDGGLSAMPIGAVFSDLVIDGTMGLLATCPGGGSDAGVPTVDAGSCGGLAALADATAASWETGPFPDVSDLNVEGSTGAPAAIAYVRFAPVSGPITSALLTMNTSSISSAGGGSGRPCLVESGAWDEATLTWATRPVFGSMCAGGARPIEADQVVSWDVTPLITPGREITFAIVSEDDDGVHYLSREAGGCASGPRLEVALAPASDAPGRDAAGLDASVDAAGMDAPSMDTGMRRAVGGGCGCSLGRDARPTALGALALGLLLVVGRRPLAARR